MGRFAFIPYYEPKRVCSCLIDVVTESRKIIADRIKTEDVRVRNTAGLCCNSEDYGWTITRSRCHFSFVKCLHVCCVTYIIEDWILLHYCRVDCKYCVCTMIKKRHFEWKFCNIGVLRTQVLRSNFQVIDLEIVDIITLNGENTIRRVESEHIWVNSTSSRIYYTKLNWTLSNGGRRGYMTVVQCLRVSCAVQSVDHVQRSEY